MQRADLERLQHELDGCLANVVELARSARTQTAAEWRALVEAMGRSEPPLPHAGDAANPAEVRAVLFAVRALYEKRLRVVEQGVDRDDDDLVDAIWTFRHRRLDSFVEEELASYIKLVAPRPSIASVFAKAAANGSTGHPAVQVTPSVQLHRCKTCGAPRRSDGLYGDCLYCGQPFFTGYKEID